MDCSFAGARAFSGGCVTTAEDVRYAGINIVRQNDSLGEANVDELIPNSATIAEIGLDHFYLDPEIDLKTVALARLVINHLKDSR